MRILITGQNEKDIYVRRLALASGHSFPEHGPWDLAVLPLPRSEIAEDLADELPKGQRIICGITDDAFERLAKRRGWKLLRVLKDEAYIQKNAILTAEGALYAAMQHSSRSLLDCSCLVIGYGRIGRALTGMLRSLHVPVTVAARRKESREEAGEPAIPLETLEQALPQMDIVFNTVPYPLIDRRLLSFVRPETVLIELASAPYGIDADAARELSLALYVESGLPGRVYPESAAKILLEYIKREAKQQ